jgi:hypothetical protein
MMVLFREDSILRLSSLERQIFWMLGRIDVSFLLGAGMVDERANLT